MNFNFQLCNHPSLVVNDDPSSNNQDRRGGRAKKKICYAEEEKSSAAPGADVSPRRRHIFNKVLHQRFCFFARASVLIVNASLPGNCPIHAPRSHGRRAEFPGHARAVRKDVRPLAPHATNANARKRCRRAICHYHSCCPLK